MFSNKVLQRVRCEEISIHLTTVEGPQEIAAAVGQSVTPRGNRSKDHCRVPALTLNREAQCGYSSHADATSRAAIPKRPVDGGKDSSKHGCSEMTERRCCNAQVEKINI